MEFCKLRVVESLGARCRLCCCYCCYWCRLWSAWADWQSLLLRSNGSTHSQGLPSRSTCRRRLQLRPIFEYSSLWSLSTAPISYRSTHRDVTAPHDIIFPVWSHEKPTRHSTHNKSKQAAAAVAAATWNIFATRFNKQTNKRSRASSEQRISMQRTRTRPTVRQLCVCALPK